MRCQEPVDVDVVRQVREGHITAVPGEFRDPLSFRGHGLRARRPCHVSLPRFMRRRPLPSPGSLGTVPPARRYYEALRLPAARFAVLRFLRLAIPSLRPLSSPTAPDAGPRIIPELVSRYLPPGPCDGNGRVSQVPGEPS